MNHVLDRYNAMINSRKTALAGCSNHPCESRHSCLRASEELKVRSYVKKRKDGGCAFYIPIEEAKA